MEASKTERFAELKTPERPSVLKRPHASQKTHPHGSPENALHDRLQNNLMELSKKRPHANGRATKKSVNVHEQKRGPFIALGCPRRFKSFVPLFVGPGVSAQGFGYVLLCHLRGTPQM